MCNRNVANLSHSCVIETPMIYTYGRPPNIDAFTIFSSVRCPQDPRGLVASSPINNQAHVTVLDLFKPSVICAHVQTNLMIVEDLQIIFCSKQHCR